MKKPNNILLNLCFCVVALIMLSACGGGGGGGDEEGVADGEGACSADSTLLICQAATVECDDSTHFCGEGESKVPRADCNPRSHDCGEDNQGTGAALACNDLLNFCGDGESETLRTDCNPRSHACGDNDPITGLPQGTGEPLDCNDLDYFCKTTGELRASCDPRSHACGAGNQGTGIALDCSSITHFCATSGIEKAKCNIATHNCGNNGDGTGERTCDPETHFCETSGIEKATCNIATHECEGTGDGTGVQTCDNSERFCFTTTKAPRADCVPETHNCGNNGDGSGERTCDNSEKFCFTDDKIVRATCATNNLDTNNNIYNCDNGVRICDNSLNWCHSPEQIVRDACDPATHNCDNGFRTCDPAIKFCHTDDQIVKATCNALLFNCEDGVRFPCNVLIKICNEASEDAGLYVTGGVDSATGYEPLNTEEPPTGGWVAALATARTDEYDESGGNADRIGAAYAHARGYTGIIKGTSKSVTVSIMGESKIDRTHNDLSAQLINGYIANSEDSTANAGTCVGTGTHSNSCGTISNHAFILEKRKQSTSVAGIIAGKSGNGGIQGIAYNAKIKPIDMFMDTDTATIRNAEAAVYANSKALWNTPSDTPEYEAIRNAWRAANRVRNDAYEPFREKRAKAIAQASGPDIAVMVNNWHLERIELARLEDVRVMVYLRAQNYYMASENPGGFGRLNAREITAWEEAAKTTVLVFGAGDHGWNTETGLDKLYTDETLSTRSHLYDENQKSARFRDNDSGSFAFLTGIPELRGKGLTVIALDSNNRIYKHSNGCDFTEAYCLGAPGVDINSATIGASNHSSHSTYEVQSGTAQASAHVAGAVAVLKGAFPHLTPSELVSIILDTADYIPLKMYELGGDTNNVYGHGKLNLARATEPLGFRTICLPSYPDDTNCVASEAGITIDNSGITLPTSFGGALDGFTVGFIDDYNRAYIGFPTRIAQGRASFTLGDTLATWNSPELQSIDLDSNSKMQFTNYDDDSDTKDTLIFTHNLPNHTIGFSYNEESKTPNLSLTDTGEELHFQKILPIAKDLMQLNSTYKLGKAWSVKNAITSGEFDTGNRFNEAMTNLNYTGEHNNLTIGAGTLKEYGQFLGASGTGAYQLSDATQSQVTHLAISQNLPRNSAIKLKYTGFKTEVDMRYNNFAKINDLTANEYQLSLTKKQILGKHDSLNIELIQPFAVTDGKLQQNTVLGYTAEGNYNNVVQNYSLTPAKRRQQLRMTWQNQVNLERKTKLFISMQYENHVDNVRDNNDSQILGGISTRF